MLDWLLSGPLRMIEQSRLDPASKPSDSGLDDAHLVRQILAGHTAHFELLMARFMPRVRGLVMGTLGPGLQGEADELIQAVFIKIYQKLDRFGFQSSFATWLYRVAYNTIQDHLRRRQTRLRLIDPNADADSASIAQTDEADGLSRQLDSELSDRFEALLDDLPQTARIAIRCHYWLDMPISEIAEVLGSNANNVKSILFRARKRLKPLLEHDHD